MNCQYFHEEYVELLDLDAGPRSAEQTELAEHLASCRSCAQFYAGISRVIAALRPSVRVSASPGLKARILDTAAREEGSDEQKVLVGAPARPRIWRLALAAGIAAVAVCAGLVFFLAHSRRTDFAKMPALSLFREACAAEQSLFVGDGIISIVNEIVVKPIADPELAKARFLPMNSLGTSGKLRYDMLALPTKPGEAYSVEDRAWYDQKAGRFARVMTVAGKAIFGNSYDGTSIYFLEPDASGVLKVVSKPVGADFRSPKNPAAFLGITALGGPSASLEKEAGFSYAGEVKLADGSPARVIKFAQDMEGASQKTRENLRDTYALFTVRKDNNTIVQLEFVMNGQSSLVIRRVSAAPSSAPGVPWNLAGIQGWHETAEMPGVRPNMVIQNVSIQHMVEKADFETYVFSVDPPWVAKQEMTDVVDPPSAPKRMFILTCVAKDHRHIVLVQSPTYNMAMGQFAKTGNLAYTSPNGCKLWAAPGGQGKWLAGILLQSAQFMTKEKPVENRTGFLIETPAGTFPALAINGPVTDAELHALVDSLIPAKEYLKEQPPAGAERPAQQGGPP